MRRIESSTAARLIRISAVSLFSLILLMTLVSTMKFFTVYAAEEEEAEADVEGKEVREISPEAASVKKWGFLAAAISVGLGSIAGGIAVAYVGAAALGVIGEKPEMAGRALIFVGLAEGIAIYGLIVAILILFSK